MARTKQPWELAAEKLVDDVRWLLRYREVIVAALGESPGRDDAESRLREMHALVTALEVELARAATADDRAAVGSIARLLKNTAATVGITVASTAGVLVTTDVYDALTAVDAQADQVIECVIEADELIHGGNVQPASDATLNVDDARHEHTASEVTIEPATVNLGAVPVDPEPVTGDAASDRRVDLASVSDAVADASGDLTVTQEGDTLTAEGTVVEGAASGTYAYAGTAEVAATAQPAEGRTRELGTAVERDVAPPITPVRGGSGSHTVPPPYSRGSAPADVAGDVAATTDQTAVPEEDQRTRELVDRATRKLVDEVGMEESQAFGFIQRRAMSERVRMGTIAQRIIDSDIRPGE